MTRNIDPPIFTYVSVDKCYYPHSAFTRACDRHLAPREGLHYGRGGRGPLPYYLLSDNRGRVHLRGEILHRATREGGPRLLRERSREAHVLTRVVGNVDVLGITLAVNPILLTTEQGHPNTCGRTATPACLVVQGLAGDAAPQLPRFRVREIRDHATEIADFPSHDPGGERVTFRVCDHNRERLSVPVVIAGVLEGRKQGLTGALEQLHRGGVAPILPAGGSLERQKVAPRTPRRVDAEAVHEGRPPATAVPLGNDGNVRKERRLRGGGCLPAPLREVQGEDGILALRAVRGRREISRRNREVPDDGCRKTSHDNLRSWRLPYRPGQPCRVIPALSVRFPSRRLPYTIG